MRPRVVDGMTDVRTRLRPWAVVAAAAAAASSPGCGRVGFGAIGVGEGGSAADGAPSDGPPAVDGDAAPDAPIDAHGRLADAGGDAARPRIRGPGAWETIPESPLEPRIWAGAVWTGTEFIVYGGAVDASLTATDTGARYNPTTGVWTEMSTQNAPPPRHSHSMAWSGEELFVYGGASGTDSLRGGGLYDPDTDTWRLINDAGSPGARTYATAMWTGSRFFVWGGWGSEHQQSGGLYDPVDDEWAPTSLVGAPSPRTFYAAVWTGQRVIVWGGCDGALASCANPLGDGAMYDPSSGTWSPMTMEGAPSPRSEPGAVWTGTEMVVFGGATGTLSSAAVGDGAAYNPATDSWRAIPMEGGPGARSAPARGRLGRTAIFWGGTGSPATGALYDPVTDGWESITEEGAPTGRNRFAHAVSSSSLFVWGGSLSSREGALWTP